MSLSEKSSARRSAAKLSAPSEIVLLGIIALCFIVLHVAALSLVTSARQSDVAGSLTADALSRGD